MRSGKITILTAFMFVMLIGLTSCSKDDGAVPERITIENVPMITTNLVRTNGTADTIFLSNQAAYQGQIKIAMYFPGEVPPTKVDLVVIKNKDSSAVKVFQADITSFPTTVTITAAQINALFGQTQIAAGETYTFAPDIYVGTKKYQAFFVVPVSGGAFTNNQSVTGMAPLGFGDAVRVRIRP